MEGFINIIIKKGVKRVKVLYLDTQGDIYVCCADLEAITNKLYSVWRDWDFGQSNISTAERVYKGKGMAHYVFIEGSYEGLWLRFDMAYLFLKFEVGNTRLLNNVVVGVNNFRKRLRVLGKQSKVSFDILRVSSNNLHLLLNEILPSVGDVLHINKLKDIISERIDGDSYTAADIYGLISVSSYFDVIRRSDGRYVKRIS